MTEAWQRNGLESSKMAKLFWIALVAAVIPAFSSAQENRVINPVYQKAQGLVNDGNAAAGRALIDSMIAVATPGSNDYAEAVYWRAVLAGTAADAEMDYRRIVVDYPQSPRVEDALIRLAQLEISRANYDGALRHLNRLVTDYPQSPSRARAGYWMARAMFEKNDLRGGCTATADALARTTEDDAELRNQITYLNQRCAGVSLAEPAPIPVVSQPSAVVPNAPDTTVNPAPSEAPRPVEKPVAESVAVVPPAEKPVSKPRPVEPGKSDKPPVVKPSAEPASVKTAYSVQIAAYNVKSQAVAMVAKLKKRGYEARVDGTVAPFRVRIGRYATQSQASAVQRSLKAKQITGFVVQAETQ
jgi:TolA-binding protein